MNKTRQAADRAWQGTRRNFLINGNMDFWQRGTSGFGATEYTCDRWGSGAGITDISRSTDAPDKSDYSCKITPTTASNFKIRQIVENGNLWLLNQEVTLSFWAKADSSKVIATDVNDSADETHNLTTSWQRFYHTVTPTGEAYDPHAYVDFSNSGATTTPFYVTQVQLELGSEATDFEYRSVAEELALCQRYFCKSYNADVDPATVTGVGTLGNMATNTGDTVVNAQFPVTMRTTPTMTWYNPITGSSSTPLRVSSGNHAVTNYQTGAKNYSCFNTTGGALTSNGTGRIHYVADAEI